MPKLARNAGAADGSHHRVLLGHVRLGGPGFPPPDQVLKTRLDENTYAAMYTSPLGGAVQLNAHILSAGAGGYCIEVHASKMSEEPEDIAPWFKSLEGARIRSD